MGWHALSSRSNQVLLVHKGRPALHWLTWGKCDAQARLPNGCLAHSIHRNLLRMLYLLVWCGGMLRWIPLMSLLHLLHLLHLLNLVLLLLLRAPHAGWIIPLIRYCWQESSR